MARLRRGGWDIPHRRPRSDTLHRPKKYLEKAANAMKLRRLPGYADRHPAASDTIVKVAAMAALRPLLRADLNRARRVEPPHRGRAGTESPDVLFARTGRRFKQGGRKIIF